MKKTQFSERARTLLFGIAAFFALGAGPLRADATACIPVWSEPSVSGSFGANGAGIVSYTFSDAGGDKNGPGGSATYSFDIQKGNFISISVSADDTATVDIPAAEISANSYWDASQKRIVPGSAESAFIDIEEIDGDTFPVTIDYRNAGGPYGLSFTITVERVKAEISAVNISAASKLTLSQDSGTAFDGNDWEKDRSRDGKLREANPISVTSGNALTFIPTFDVFVETAPAKVKAEFSVPGKAASSQIKDYSAISSGFSIPAPVASGNIDYFDNSLTVAWSVQYAGCDKWFPAGTSSHEIYFTRAAPQTSLRQETLFWVACSGAVVGKTTDEEITDAIWSKFSTGNAPANLKRKDGKALTYWGADEQTPDVDVSGLISGLDGKCGAWASFFNEVLGIQGVFAVPTTLYPIEKERDGLLIDNYEFSEVFAQGLPDGFTHFLDHSSTGDVPDGYAKDRVGIAGQNNGNPYSLLKNHQLIFADTRFLDPSYGRTLDVLQNKDCIIAGSVRDEAFSGKNIANNARSFSYEIGMIPTSLRDAESKIAAFSTLDAKLGTWEKGETVLLWEQRKVFAEDRFCLYQTDNAKRDEALCLDLEKRKGEALRAAGISVPSYLKRVRFPLESNFWFGGMARNFQLVRQTTSGVIVSAQIHGYKLMWEYDPEKEQWSEYPCGEILSEPNGGVVSAALWFLRTLKRNGVLDGVSPKDYPIICLFSSKELAKEKNITARELTEILRERERILREAIFAEFSADIMSYNAEE